MKVDFLLLVDAASLGAQGNLNLLGEYNVLLSTEFPVVVPRIVVVARISNLTAADYKKTHAILIKISDSKKSGAVRVQGNGAFKAGPPKYDDIPTRGDLIAPLYGTVFPKPGEYKVTLAIDGKLAATSSLFVKSAPKPAA